MARWRSSDAAVCKTDQAGATPVRASKIYCQTCADDGQKSLCVDMMSYNIIYARMMESVDMRDLKSLGRKAVRVQVPLCAPKIMKLG